MIISSRFYLIQSCYSASSADIRFSGSYYNNREMKSLAVSDIYPQSVSWKVNLPILTFFIISLSEMPLNGGIPQSNIYAITPHDHKSHK